MKRREGFLPPPPENLNLKVTWIYVIRFTVKELQHSSEDVTSDENIFGLNPCWIGPAKS
jgi:hypothetical protein